MTDREILDELGKVFAALNNTDVKGIVNLNNIANSMAMLDKIGMALDERIKNAEKAEMKVVK